MSACRTLSAVMAGLIFAVMPAGGAWAEQAYDEDLVIMLQSGLHRVGCLSSEPDGTWGATSKAALGEFARRIGQTMVGLAPSQQALALVDQYDDEICFTGRRPLVDDVPEEVDDDVTEEVENVVPQLTKTAPTVVVEPKPAPVVKVRTCVLATVTVGAKPNFGAQWDFPGKAPDVRFSELTTGATSFCNNSYSCQLRIMSGADLLTFQIVDDDGINADDPIGSGQCVVASQCSLPPAASISMVDCS